MITTPAFKDRKFAVLGLARSGLSAVRALVAGASTWAEVEAGAAARAAAAAAANAADAR